MKIKYFLIPIFLLLNKLNIYGQVIETESLFEFYEGNFQRNIRISDRVKEEWNLENNFLQHTHYNANKDKRIDSVQLVNQVFMIFHYGKKRTEYVIELVDDGKHYDKEACDKIFGNYLIGEFESFYTEDTRIYIDKDSISILYSIFQPPVTDLCELPTIILPENKAILSSDQPEICWKIDTNADGCGVILLESTPILGEELKDIVWQKEYRSNKNIYIERIPKILAENKEYILLLWSYTNTKQLNDSANLGSYSLDWVKFSINISDEKKFSISQNFPNPFNSSTIINYRIPIAERVTIKIFDAIGREIKILMNQVQFDGEHSILWNGKDNFGNEVSSGTYFYNIRFGEKSITKKMLLVR